MSCTTLTGLLVSVSVVVRVSGSLKVWGRQLSLDSGSDWVGGRRPCAGQLALLPDNLAIYLQSQLEARTMVLPSNGEVIFGEGASISLADKVSANDDRCKGAGSATVRFGGGSARWFDANSWHQAALPSPVPHSERVPCSSGRDEVLFPENITYRARVQRPATVAALSIGPHVMTNDRFRAFRASGVGRSLFDVRDRFNISEVSRPCGNEGCTCGNDRPEVLSVICGATKCPEALCSDPIQPAGHCCPMCGAFLSVRSAGGGLPLSELRRLLQQLSPAASQVRWHVSRTHDRQLLTVLVDAVSERQNSRKIAEALLSRLTGSAQYGVSSAVLRASGPRQAALMGGGGGGSAVAPVLVVIALIVVAGLLIWAVRTKRVSVPERLTSPSQWRPPPPPSQWRLRERAAQLAPQLRSVRRRLATAAAANFQFARFRNSTAGSEVELGGRVEELESVRDSASVGTAESSESESTREAPPQPRISSRAESPPPDAGAPAKAPRTFDNPMFGNKNLDDNPPPTLLAPTSALCVTPDGKAVANPFFGVPVISVTEDGPQAVSAAPPAPPTGPSPPEDDEPTASPSIELSQPSELPQPTEPAEQPCEGPVQAPQTAAEEPGQEQGDRELLIDVED